MTEREKLREILDQVIFPHVDADPLDAVTDYLLDSDVRPVRHGRWIREPGTSSWGCSACGETSTFPANAFGRPFGGRYCPMCGAKMDEEAGRDDGL